MTVTVVVRIPLSSVRLCLLIAAAETNSSLSLACSYSCLLIYEQTAAFVRKSFFLFFLLLLLLCELLCLFWLHKHHTRSGQCVFHFQGRKRNTPIVVGKPILRLYAMFIFIMCFSTIYNLLLHKLLI